MRLEFHPDAEMEFIEAASYYENRVTGLGERFGREVERTTALLLMHPKIGSEIAADLRQIALDRFPYTLIYSLAPDMLHVLAVAHKSRRPDYWRSRA
jgi:plasmid stabilization system protein ParE